MCSVRSLFGWETFSCRLEIVSTNSPFPVIWLLACFGPASIHVHALLLVQWLKIYGEEMNHESSSANRPGCRLWLCRASALLVLIRRGTPDIWPRAVTHRWELIFTPKFTANNLVASSLSQFRKRRWPPCTTRKPSQFDESHLGRLQNSHRRRKSMCLLSPSG